MYKMEQDEGIHGKVEASWTDTNTGDGPKVAIVTPMIKVETLVGNTA